MAIDESLSRREFLASATALALAGGNAGAAAVPAAASGALHELSAVDAIVRMRAGSSVMKAFSAWCRLQRSSSAAA